MLPLHLQAPGLNTSKPIRRLGRRLPLAGERARKIRLRDVQPILPAAPETWQITLPEPHWLMLANDQLGDCGPAAWYHAHMGRLATTGKYEPAAVADVIQFYEQTGGYRPGHPWTDNGVNNVDMLQTAITSGYPVNGRIVKLDGCASINTKAPSEVSAAAWNLGGLLVGISLSRTCYDNWGPAATWYVDNSRIVGGHDVYLCGANPTGPLVVSWGEVTQCTWAWLAYYADEADALLQIADMTGAPQMQDGLNVEVWIQAAERYCGITT